MGLNLFFPLGLHENSSSVCFWPLLQKEKMCGLCCSKVPSCYPKSKAKTSYCVLKNTCSNISKELIIEKGQTNLSGDYCFAFFKTLDHCSFASISGLTYTMSAVHQHQMMSGQLITDFSVKALMYLSSFKHTARYSCFQSFKACLTVRVKVLICCNWPVLILTLYFTLKSWHDVWTHWTKNKKNKNNI